MFGTDSHRDNYSEMAALVSPPDLPIKKQYFGEYFMKLAGIFIVSLAILFVAGCATSGNDAFVAAHQSQAAARSNEAGAKAKVETERVNAISEIAKTCQDVGCKAMAMMSITYAGQAQTSAPAPALAIAAPVNEFVDGLKSVAKTALQAYGLRLDFAGKVVDAMKGPSDKDVARDALGVVDIIRGQ